MNPFFQPLSERWVKKYMRTAREFGEDDNRCLSRRIGSVIVDPYNNKILSMGLNGPPRGIQPCNSRWHLETIFWPQLKTDDKLQLQGTLSPYMDLKDAFLHKYADCDICPRRLVGAKSGERLELCSCSHSERNAIDNAGGDLNGSWMFAWCGLPCWECSKAIIQVGIKKLFLVKEADYHPQARELLAAAGVVCFAETPEYYASPA